MLATVIVCLTFLRLHKSSYKGSRLDITRYVSHTRTQRR